jgi:alpha-glucosidase
MVFTKSGKNFLCAPFCSLTPCVVLHKVFHSQTDGKWSGFAAHTKTLRETKTMRELSKNHAVPSSALSLAGVLLGLWLAEPVEAAPIGAARQLQAVSGAAAQWELRSDRGVLLRISLPRVDVLRLQASAKGSLTGPGDGAAPIVVGQPAVQVEHLLEEHSDHWQISTSQLRLRIDKKPLRLSLYRTGESKPLWREVEPLDLAEKLAVQTLSSEADERFYGGGQQNGSFEFKGKQLEISYSGGWEEGDRPSPAPFLMSSRGWGMLRHTWAPGSYDLRLPERIALAHQEGRFDAYYFVGSTIREVLARYTEWTGRARLLPRWALEYGDADCYNDSDNAKKPGTAPTGWSDGPSGKTLDVVETVAKPYREHDMPGGWILPNDGYGCGYTALPETVQQLAELGFRTGLWTENGVDKIAWEVGTAGSRAQKLDVAWTGKGYQFSLDANKAAYEGILGNSDARPFVWTVMGWAGTQRYGVTWTGDQSGSWDYIRWHIPTLIGSGLSGQVYATGDVDGIFGGSPETYTRDLQWKAFTPVLMGMSGWAAAARKHPWWFEEPFRSINRRYLKLKLRLTPYMYTLAREAELSGAPLVRGLMWDQGQDPQAWSEAHKYQFLLGRDLLVAPVYRSQVASKGWRTGIHVPQGRWIDYWDGRQLRAPAAGRGIDLQVTLDKLPLFVRAGAILPMYPEMLFDGHKPKDRLTLDLYPDTQVSRFTLYEDDGLSRRYQQGEFSEQDIAMRLDGAVLNVDVAPVRGQYTGQLPQRGISLRVLSREAPRGVLLDGRPLPRLADLAALEAANEGWLYVADERLGSLHVKSAARDIRQAALFQIEGVAVAPLNDDEFPAAPERGPEIPADEITVMARPAEETGHPLELAFDGKPDTWFRTQRTQTVKAGAHEWVLGFAERRQIAGVQIAPRNSANWKHGQVRDYEIYVGDRMGEWGEPVARGRLALQQDAQRITLPTPSLGRLLRFRVLSTHHADAKKQAAIDAAASRLPRPVDAALAPEVGPVTLSEFRVIEYRPVPRAEQQVPLATLALPAAIRRDRPQSSATEMRMNGLLFRHGLGFDARGRLDLKLNGDWRWLRADVGIDDSCKAAGGLQFQIWSGERLLWDSGLVQAPAVLKPDIDVRGLSRLSLRTLGAQGSRPAAVCGNWANARLIGLQGDQVSTAR